MGVKQKLMNGVNAIARASRKYLPQYYSARRPILSYYFFNFDNAKIQSQTILYETRDGQSITDSPLYIFLELVKNEKYHNWRHVWVLKDAVSEQEALVNVPLEFRDRIEIVRRDTIEYMKWLLEAEYVITNSTFQSFYAKRPGQTYINTWHGTPLKYMGYDIPGSKTSLKNVQRNFLMTDYLLSPNEHTTHIFADRYKLNGLYEGKILETGYPRNDVLQHRDETILRQLVVDGVQLNGKPIVLYTPTWKGTSITNPSGSMQQIVAEVNVIQAMNPDKQVLVKVHPYAYSMAKQEQNLVDILIPDQYDANRVLSVTDYLITDYSSIFFDFLVTGRPIFFYAWDKEQYDLYRGMYLEDSELPAPVMEDIHDIGKAIAEYSHNQPEYDALAQRMVAYDDGHVTERIVARIFEGNTTAITLGHELVLPHDKPKVLIFTGGMVNNGITQSMINLSRNFDYEKYDLSIMTWDSTAAEKVANVNQLDERARLVYRFGRAALTTKEFFGDTLITRFGLQFWNKWLLPVKGYRRELYRLTGHVHYRAVIDFSGYSYNGAKLLAFSDAEKKSVYQHNDLWTDAHKVVKGKQANKHALLALFSIYRYFDRVVSVSEALSQINEVKLAKYLNPGSQTFVRNSMNISEGSANSEQSNTAIKQLNSDVYLNGDMLVGYARLDEIGQVDKIAKFAVVTDNIQAVAEITVQEQTYYKLIVDGLPSIWAINDNVFLVEHVHLISDQTTSLVGWVKPNKRRILAAPYGMDSEEVAVSRGRLLNNSFVKIIQIVQNTDGTYYRLDLPNVKSAWLNAKSVKLLKGSQLSFFQRFYNTITTKKIETTYEPVHAVMWTDPSIDTYKEPLGLGRRSQKAHRSMLPLTYVYNRSITGAGEFYEILSAETKHVWANSREFTPVLLRTAFRNVEFDITEYINRSTWRNIIWLNGVVAGTDLQGNSVAINQYSQENDDWQAHKIDERLPFIGQQSFLLESKRTGRQVIVASSDILMIDTRYFGQSFRDDKQQIKLARVRDFSNSIWLDVIYHLDEEQVELVTDESQQILEQQKKLEDTMAKLGSEVLYPRSIEVASTTKQDVENYLAKLQAEFAIDMTEVKTQVPATVHVNDNVQLIKKREHQGRYYIDDEISVNLFDKIDGTLVDRQVLENIFVQTSYVLTEGVIWYEIVFNSRTYFIKATDVEVFQVVDNENHVELEPNHINFVAMGRLSPEKNHTNLILAFKAVVERYGNAHLYILGDGAMRKALTELIRMLDLKANVHLVGYVTTTKEYLAATDFFVHPSYYEGQPMVLLEALEQSAIVIASNIKANIGVVGNQKFAYISNGVDANALADALNFSIEHVMYFEEFDTNRYNTSAVNDFVIKLL
ncbi:glycosyltransferase [Weissella soli]|uniref:CDP-glycerol glycerophosphotransferase family protein n=1 Tax=Weissella soli TaxID=155866 RepID=UPI0021BFE8B5|nr:CDP-glycerol glycerophosphotransferase family protein [Weissella soli]MCT8395769.1 glycosyltransferase [Weissella soli]